ncbi:MAG: ABC transporter [Halobacteriovoraceae bacterium]|nr:ABC transporter [Halobacteriovoraceae bacterium]|tara:strand:+ start:22794 stop:23744 length:951 start_codon:yes stop_codon:yes gene_type:complete
MAKKIYDSVMREIIVEGITKSFGNRKVLDNISFTVHRGEIHGFLGPNGAGKTTTMKILTQLLSADSGAVTFQNKNLQASVGFLLDEPPLYSDMTVREYLKFLAQLRSVPAKLIEENVEYALSALDLKPIENRLIENISKGYKQRVGIAQAIVHKPEVLILDEPTVGLDPKSVVEIRNFIKGLREEHTILLSSHLLYEMGLVCDRITIIKNGEIVETGEIKEIRKKLAGKNHLQFRTKKESQELDLFIQQLPGYQSFHKEKIDNEFSYQVHFFTEQDIRSEVVAKTVELNAELVFFQQKELSLEDIFMQVTDGDVTQ